MTLIALLSLTGLICGSAAVLVPVWFFRSRRQIREIREEVNNLTRRLQQVEARGQSGEGRAGCRLTEKQLAARFENVSCGRVGVSEKYRHVGQLARSGLGVADIAEILEVSRNEAEQMLELAGSGRQSA